MDNDINRMRALNEAIWLRDNATRLPRPELVKIVTDITRYEVYSARQLSTLTGGILSHQTVARLAGKTAKTGGRLAPESLDDIKQCFHDRVSKNVNFITVKRVLDSGTSQGMLKKLSGISQAKISKGVTKLGPL